jgi:hypothetical protein
MKKGMHIFGKDPAAAYSHRIKKLSKLDKKVGKYDYASAKLAYKASKQKLKADSSFGSDKNYRKASKYEAKAAKKAFKSEKMKAKIAKSISKLEKKYKDVPVSELNSADVEMAKKLAARYLRG